MSDDDLSDDGGLLSPAPPLTWEPEGPETPDERLDDLSGLVQDRPLAPDPRWDEGPDDPGDDLSDLRGLVGQPLDATAGWDQDEGPTAAAERPHHRRALRLPPSPPRPARALKPLTVGHRLRVDLPDFGLEGLPGRCLVHRAGSSLRIPMRGEAFRHRVRLSLGGRELSLPLVEAEGPAVRLRLRIRAREVEATLTLVHGEGPPRLLLGRDVLAAAALVVDVRLDEAP